ncbi:ABC transporter substrate-binding protein [Paenibacillus puerhi]|uniref:ABC transporter substrate-binding protein n=1 Tax=Paenibacillus puerhi TaxID=2692622 RepID=UPI00135BD8C0|nr:ABC transporter substrate-binding protein [Paenibacillus puerhi]
MKKRSRSRSFAAWIALLLSISLLQACGTQPAGSSERASGDKPASAQEAVTITVGYQSPTAQTWGALIIKNQKLFEKYLVQQDPNRQIKVEWFDAPAGSVLNNNMAGGKIQISFLGDMPSLLNGVLGITQANYRSVFLAFDGKGAQGRNQALLVPKDSGIKSIVDLKGKTVSTPIGSSAHRMLLESLRKVDLVDQVTIVDQSVTVGMQSIEQNKVAAHSTWEPYPTLMQVKDVGKVLQFGEDTQIDYLAGVVANRDWAESEPDYVKAFLRALSEAHEYAISHPEETAKIFQEESKFPAEVCAKMVQNIRFDAAIYQKDVATLNGSIDFLTSIGKLQKKLDLKSFVDDRYLRSAVQMNGRTYLTDAELQGDWIKGKVY